MSDLFRAREFGQAGDWQEEVTPTNLGDSKFTRAQFQQGLGSGSITGSSNGIIGIMGFNYGIIQLCAQLAEPKMSTWVEIALGLIKGVPWHPKGSSSCQEITLKTRGFPIDIPACWEQPQRRPCVAAHPFWWLKLNVPGCGRAPKGLVAPGQCLLAIWPHMCPFLLRNEADLPHGGLRTEPQGGGTGMWVSGPPPLPWALLPQGCCDAFGDFGPGWKTTFAPILTSEPRKKTHNSLL